MAKPSKDHPLKDPALVKALALNLVQAELQMVASKALLIDDEMGHEEFATYAVRAFIYARNKSRELFLLGQGRLRTSRRAYFLRGRKA